MITAIDNPGTLLDIPPNPKASFKKRCQSNSDNFKIRKRNVRGQRRRSPKSRPSQQRSSSKPPHHVSRSRVCFRPSIQPENSFPTRTYLASPMKSLATTPVSGTMIPSPTTAKQPKPIAKSVNMRKRNSSSPERLFCLLLRALKMAFVR